MGRRNKALKKYLKYSFLFWIFNIRDKATIKKGFRISTGWNLGKKNKSNHLFEPFTSTPRKGTSNKLINAIENKIKVMIASVIKTACLKKK